MAVGERGDTDGDDLAQQLDDRHRLRRLVAGGDAARDRGLHRGGDPRIAVPEHDGGVAHRAVEQAVAVDVLHVGALRALEEDRVG